MYMYLIVIVLHEMHDRMHPNYCQIIILLAHDRLPSHYWSTHVPYDDPHLSCFSRLVPIKTLLAWQLPTNVHVHEVVILVNAFQEQNSSCDMIHVDAITCFPC